MAKRPKLVLIDGKSVFHRGYHALPGLTNSQGVPTSGVYGFASMVLKMLSELKPDYVVVAWDKAKTSLTSRTKLYAEYKAQRIKQPDDFYQQIPWLRQVIEAFGWPLVEIDGYEADDIIGTFAKQAKDLETIIVTSDLDVLQLLDDHTKVYASRRGLTDTIIYDLERMKERYGLTPQQFIDYKALRGDASDNIPGVPGIGEKTAAGLTQTYGSLDGVYAHLDEIKGKLQERLRDNRQMAYLSRQLVEINRDLPLKLDLKGARADKLDRQKLYELFRTLDFRSLLDKLPGPPAEPAAGRQTSLLEAPASPVSRSHLDGVKYQSVTTPAELASLARQTAQVKALAFDCETDGYDPIQAKLAGLALSWEEGEAYYIPVGHEEGKQLPIEQVVKALKPVLEDPKIAKVGHNLKFDYQLMRRYGVKTAPLTFDTMIAAFLINPLVRARTLSDLAFSELGIEMIDIKELIGSRGKNQSSFDMVNIEDATRYAAEDADISWRLYKKLNPELAQSGLAKLAEDMEWPLIPVLAEMELTGVQLDVEFLKKLNKSVSAKILELDEKICRLAGERFNINSPGQLGRILFEKLGLKVPGVRRGKSGSLSTAVRELEKMRGMHPMVDHLFEYRELVKLKTTYIDALPLQVAPDGRVHTSYSQTIAQTGRLSSNNPNLQNIPIRTDLGRQIRHAFVAPKGRVLVSADYSQFELRIAAFLSQDAGMIKAFREGIDLHAATAAEMFGVALDQVTKQQRYNAKTINFGVLYGMSPHGVSVATGMSREEASEFIKRYYELRPKLKAYLEKVIAETKQKEYAETLFGRRRPLPEINSNNYMIASGAERMAVNVPIQGTQADLMKMAMIALAPKLGPETQMLLQIHDQLIVETDESKGERVAQLMQETLEGVYNLGVPIVVDTAIGQNWGEL